MIKSKINFSPPKIVQILLILGILGLFSSKESFSQATWHLIFEGKVLDEDTQKPMENVDVTVYKDGNEIKKLATSLNGKFSYTFDPNAEYELKFSKQGYTSKKLAFSTKLGPPSETDIRLVGNEVLLFKVDPDLDVSVLDKPVGKFVYDPVEKNFNYDKVYTQSIKAKVDVLVKTLEVKR